MERTASILDFSLEVKIIAQYAKDIGNPLRVQILKILNQQSCNFKGDLTEIIPLTQSTISQHLKALKVTGIIQGEIIPPKINYCLNKAN
jgi:ArsR family transcriptional regulator